MDQLNRLRWLKSSYSNGGGGQGAGNCVEVAAVWLKSSYSNGGGNGGGNCVETAAIGSNRALRDSKDPNGPAFVFSRDSFDRFIAAVKTGDFDR